jgi:hypothetical protein
MDDPIDRALAALANADAARQAPAHLEPRILAAFDRRRERSVLRWWVIVAWDYRREAAAVVIAASITTVAHFRLLERNIIEPGVPEAPVQAQVARRAEVPATMDESPQQPPTTPSPAATRPVRRVRAAAVTADPTWRQSDDIVHSVHVRMPRAMLSMLGVPLIEPAAEGTVNVEVLLGPDGIARTIRIVP